MATDGPDPDMTAAELALGVLDGDERAAALRRVIADPAFAREVEEWRDRLAVLFDDYAAVPAPATLPDPVERVRAAPRPRLWTAMAIAGALAAAIVLFVALRPPTPISAPAPSSPALLVATLVPGDGPRPSVSPVSAVVDRASGDLRIAAAAMAPAGKSAELWLIRDGVPHALGLLANGGPTRLTVPAAQRATLASGMVLAISIEPPGGSPKAVPTGPVVASGALSET